MIKFYQMEYYVKYYIYHMYDRILLSLKKEENLAFHFNMVEPEGQC